MKSATTFSLFENRVALEFLLRGLTCSTIRTFENRDFTIFIYFTNAEFFKEITNLKILSLSHNLLIINQISIVKDNSKWKLISYLRLQASFQILLVNGKKIVGHSKSRFFCSLENTFFFQFPYMFFFSKDYFYCYNFFTSNF